MLVNNRTFDIFIAIEEEVRKMLGRDMVLSDEVKTKIASSENVNFFGPLCAPTGMRRAAMSFSK